jgi:hypothetical protein
VIKTTLAHPASVRKRHARVVGKEQLAEAAADRRLESTLNPRYSVGTGFLTRLQHLVLRYDRVADLEAFVTDLYLWASDQLSHIALRLVAEGATEDVYPWPTPKHR